MRKFALLRETSFFKPPWKKWITNSEDLIMTTINLAESQNLPFALPAPLFRVPYTLRGSTAIVALHLSRVLYKFTPFYAKQTQFPGCSNERKFNFNRVLWKCTTSQTRGKQTQYKPKQSQFPRPQLPGRSPSFRLVLRHRWCTEAPYLLLFFKADTITLRALDRAGPNK